MKEEKVKWKRIKERMWDERENKERERWERMDERESEMGEIGEESVYDKIEN